MTDYTPTTAKMFEAYYNYLRHTSRTSRDAEAEFDRWLAEVQADAFDTGFSTARLTDGEVDNPFRENRLAKAIQNVKKRMTL